MATTYRTPGVYIEEITKIPPSVVPVETAIPAFIGYTEKAERTVANDLHLKPTRISSLVEYDTLFGGAQPERNIVVTIDEKRDGSGSRTSIRTAVALDAAKRSTYLMRYALELFFANGGSTCYIVSVGPYTAFAEVGGGGGGASEWTPAPIDGAVLGQGLTALALQDEPTLIVFPDSVNLSTNNYSALHQDALEQCAELMDRFVLMDVPVTPLDTADRATFSTAVDAFRTAIGVNDLKYGAVYAPNLQTGIDYLFDESTTRVRHVLNGTATAIGGADADEGAALASLSGTNNEFFQLARTAIRDTPCVLPPSSAMAGVYTRVDADRGVWKAPANVSLSSVIGPTVTLADRDQDGLNVDANGGKSINVIRTFTGRGTLVWGARTLAGNDNEWRYVNVRRFFNFVEESTKKSTMGFVFEPNDANTWVRVQAMIENFLTTLWRQGALQGAKPEDAFKVAVGLNKTMTALDILEGRMVVEIGLAVVRPAEFIILRFSHAMAKS